jgi:arylsulfatase A-like enzyme
VDPTTGKRCTKWVLPREEVYSGEYLAQYPEVLFRLSDQYGAGWQADGDLFGSSYSHSIQSGSHNEDTPVLILNRLRGKTRVRKEAALMDIFPTILDIVGMEDDSNVEGHSILQ